MGPEAKLEQALRMYAEKRGCLSYKFTSPSRRGVPDRIFVAPGGRILFLELKAPGEKPTKLQLHEMRKLADKGCTVDWTDNLVSGMNLIDKLLG